VKALIVTGKLAYPIVKEVIKKYDNIDVKVLNYPVAALMSIRYILENLKNIDRNYDVIILPGLVNGDAKIIEDTLGIKTFKGTENAWDIPLVFDALEKGIQLSTIDPADEIISKINEKNIYEYEEKITNNMHIAFDIGIKIPLYPPPFRIFLELDPKWDCDKIREEIQRTRNFVDVFVIGFPVGHTDNDEVRRKINIAIDEGIIVGIDADSPKELIYGVKNGAKFVFNLNEANIDNLTEIKKEAAFIVAPFNVENRGDITINLVKKAKNLGYDKLIADSVLSPPLEGLVDSLFEYKKVRKLLPDVPLLMGILNVSELIDADSHSINALLTSIAGEIGISNLLVMEKGKTKWSSWETKIATQLVGISMIQRKPPKDVGIDLLILKDKKKVKDEVNIEKAEIAEYSPPDMDPAGFAKVFKLEDKIGVEFYGKKKITIIGNDGLSVGRKLVKEIDISSQHALYIGYELAKAEIAMNLDKNYIQDVPLFKKLYVEKRNE
jgi:dihydropteroate synthase-like protein